MCFLKRLVLVAALGLPFPALAQTCGDFTDVTPANFFCNNVEWIKNRGVTLGCTTTTYCPDDVVLRSQMAAFMNRLGTALTPTIIRVTDGTFNGTYNPSAVGCVSNPVAITGFPRQASLAGVLWNFNANGFKLIQVNPVYSTNGGGTWLPWPDFSAGHTIDLSEHRTLPIVAGPLDLAVGSTYLFALNAITGHALVTVQGQCELVLRIENRNPNVSPRDPS
jgi:hypothetical protein